VDEKRDNPIAITTALQGAGGYGKTTLAIALCHDHRVVGAFDDGILWTTLGQNPNVLGELTKLYEALTGEQPDAWATFVGCIDKDCLNIISGRLNRSRQSRNFHQSKRRRRARSVNNCLHFQVSDTAATGANAAKLAWLDPTKPPIAAYPLGAWRVLSSG